MQNEWLYEPVITYFDSILFYNAINRHNDLYSYQPIALAKRFEIGTKYRFFCIAKPKEITGPLSHFANIEIYQPLRGMPYVTFVHRHPFRQLS